MRAVRTAPAGSPGAALGSILEDLRQQAQLTFVELAERTAALGDPSLAVSAATLKRAAGCRVLPKENTVVAYVRGCGATLEQERKALELWKRARAKERGVLRRLHAPGVHSIRTRQDFTAALAAVYEGAGAPPLRIVQQRVGTVPQPDGAPGERGVFLLPLGTLWRIVHRKIKLPTWNQCEAFLRGCGVTGQRTLTQWQQAWRQAYAGPAAAPGPGHRREGHGDLTAVQRRHVLRSLDATSSPLDSFSVNGPSSHRIVPLELLSVRDNAVLTNMWREVFLSARRNGAAPDTVVISADGSIQLLQTKPHRTYPRPLPWPAPGRTRPDTPRSPQPCPACARPAMPKQTRPDNSWSPEACAYCARSAMSKKNHGTRRAGNEG